MYEFIKVSILLMISNRRGAAKSRVHANSIHPGKNATEKEKTLHKPETLRMLSRTGEMRYPSLDL